MVFKFNSRRILLPIEPTWFQPAQQNWPVNMLTTLHLVLFRTITSLYIYLTLGYGNYFHPRESAPAFALTPLAYQKSVQHRRPAHQFWSLRGGVKFTIILLLEGMWSSDSINTRWFRSPQLQMIKYIIAAVVHTAELSVSVNTKILSRPSGKRVEGFSCIKVNWNCRLYRSVSKRCSTPFAVLLLPLIIVIISAAVSYSNPSVVPRTHNRI